MDADVPAASFSENTSVGQSSLRKYDLPGTPDRSLGENTSKIVEDYIRGQVGKEDIADPRFRHIMRQFTVTRNDIRMADPSETNSGRYWYNLHVVHDLNVVRKIAVKS